MRPSRKLVTLGWLLYKGPDPKESDAEIVIIARTYDYEENRWAEFTAFPQVVLRQVNKEPNSGLALSP